MHDKVDAYGAAWIASLPDNDRVTLGSPEENDAIYLPKLNGLSTRQVLHDYRLTKSEMSNVDLSAGNPASDSNSQYTKLCPACNIYTFTHLHI
jgi:hypothetical protein